MFAKNSWLPRALVLVLLSLSMVQVACNRAKFTATEGVGQDKRIIPEDFGIPPASTVPAGDIIGCRERQGNPPAICTTPRQGPEQPPFVQPPVQPPQVDGNCVTTPYTNAQRSGITGIDVWFVVDSSGSFGPEREAVAAAIGNTLTTMALLNVPINLSIVAPHRPVPDNPYRGAFVNTIQLPAVSNSELINNAANQLVETMRNMPRDAISISTPHDGANELGLVAFNEMLNSMKTNQSARPNQAFAVMFLSDENDVCMARRSGVNSQQGELEMHDAYCGNVTPMSVYQNLRSFAGPRPTVVSSIIYTGARNYVDDGLNGIGYGYSDVTSLASGSIIELQPRVGTSDEQYRTEMAQNAARVLEYDIRQTSAFHNTFPVLDQNGNTVNIDAADNLSQILINGNGVTSFDVLVNGTPADYTIDRTHNVVILRPESVGNNVTVRYCL